MSEFLNQYVFDELFYYEAWIYVVVGALLMLYASASVFLGLSPFKDSIYNLSNTQFDNPLQVITFGISILFNIFFIYFVLATSYKILKQRVIYDS